MKIILLIAILCCATVLSAQNKIDSLFQTPNRSENLQELNKPQTEKPEGEIKMPLQYLQLQSKINKLDEKFLLNNKLLQTELQENYVFSREELNSGLSEDQLIAYLKNKKETMKILADIYNQHSYVNWDKIQKILGLSQTAVAIILGMINLMRYR